MAPAICLRSVRLAFLFLACCGSVCAQEASVALGGSMVTQVANQATQAVNHQTTLSSGTGIQLLGYIILIVLLAVAAVAVLFKGGFLGVITGNPKAERKLHIEESRSLGHRQYLVVAAYEGRRFLLGVCPGSIEYLSGLDSDAATPAGSFQELLASDMKSTAKGKVDTSKEVK